MPHHSTAAWSPMTIGRPNQHSIFSSTVRFSLRYWRTPLSPVNGLRKAGERYTAVSAYKAAIASTSRRGQARDHVSAQRRAADSVSTVITEFRLMLASVGDPDDDITRLLLGLCSSHTPARPMALINSALGETMGNEAITSKGEGWCCDRQRLPGLTQAAFAPGRAQRCWRLRRRVGSRRCLRYCRWLLVRVSLLVRTTTRRARRSPFRRGGPGGVRGVGRDRTTGVDGVRPGGAVKAVRPRWCASPDDIVRNGTTAATSQRHILRSPP